MSEIMVKQYFSSTKPYLYPAREVDRNYIPNFNPQNNTSVQLRFLFTNLGNTSVKYFADEITLHGSSINPQKISTILFPNQKGYITSNIYQTNTNIGYGDGLEGSIKVIFWATDVQEEKYFFYRKFTLAPGLIITIDAEEFGML